MNTIPPSSPALAFSPVADFGSSAAGAGAGAAGTGGEVACAPPVPHPAVAERSEAEPLTLGAVAERSEAEPRILSAIPVQAMEDVMAMRAQQIVQYGHTLEADQRRPIGDFARDLESLARAIREDVQWHKPAHQLRRRSVKLAALCLAMIDRIDGASAPEGNPHG